MKHFLGFLFFSLALLGLALGADNYTDRQLYQPGGTSAVTLHSTDASGVHTPHVIVDSGSTTIPTGAATSAKQDTGNASLSSIDGKITAVNTGAVVLTRSSTGATAQVTLSTSASLVAAQNTARRSLLVRNADATISAYVGFTSGVTSSTGFILKAGESTTITTTAAVYMIAASGTPAVHTLSEND